MTLSRPLYRGSVTYADETLPAFRHGGVRVNGRKATILDFDVDDKNHASQVDVLREVTVTEGQGTIVLEGESLARVQMHEGDTRTKVIVDLSGKCRSCS